jgi:purine-binding chemotaxis protein CheW
MDERLPLPGDWRAVRAAPPLLHTAPRQEQLALDAYLQTLLASVPASVETVEQAPLEAAAARGEGTVHLPAWMRTEFTALFFKAHGLVLATPLLAVKRIHELNDAPCALPGRPSWLLGLVGKQGETVGILHTAELLMGRERLGTRDFSAQPYRKLLFSRQGRYAFACDEVLDMGKLHPTEVAWRNPASLGRRPWLVGMVPQRLCALVELERLAPLLCREEAEIHKPT